MNLDFKKKILFLNTCFEWGGGEKWTFETAQELINRNYNVIIGCRKNSALANRCKKENIAFVNIEISSSFTVFNPFKLLSFIRFLKKNYIDILFLNLPSDLKFGAVAAKIAGVKKIIYRRGSAIPIKNRFYNKLLLKYFVNIIIANSFATKDTLLKNTSDWLEEKKIKVIHNGIKINDILNGANPEFNLRKEFKINKSDIVLINVGRLCEQKGHNILIDAIKVVKEKYSGFKLLIVGEGELKQKLIQMTCELNLQDKIIFTGFRNDVPLIISQSDFMVHTSLWEGFGFVIAEAMALGKPVICSDVSNIREIIEDGVSGYIVQNKNYIDVAEKIIIMLNNPDRNKMGDLGKKNIEKNFDFYDKINSIELLINK